MGRLEAATDDTAEKESVDQGVRGGRTRAMTLLSGTGSVYVHFSTNDSRTI